MSEPMQFEWGVRLADGEEVWAVQHGADGTWIPWARDYGFEDAVDIDDEEHGEISIYRSLDKAGIEGVALRRTWVAGPVEEIPRHTQSSKE